MSTRSITIVIDESWGKRKELCVIYRHCGGYPTGHGADLKRFLVDLHVVNGIGGNMPKRYCNGVGRLAAAIVCFLDSEGHDPAVYAAGTRDVWEEYTYTVVAQFEKPIRLIVQDGEKVLFDGAPVDFDPEKDYERDEDGESSGLTVGVQQT